eukprot:TRINITY_DN16435_c0_g1_i6.p1 TRINITY_DN16435_c0_g1~~TRINITY_DN16435_c0_g1_i6.p1  ORF type:complete len:123 (+),score=10.28 TRINITY_DN16435_c0_g1_i6:407-775(+)
MESQWRDKIAATKAYIDEVDSRLRELASRQQDISRGTFNKILKVQVKELQDISAPNLYIQLFHNQQKFKTKAIPNGPYAWNDTFSLYFTKKAVVLREIEATRCSWRCGRRTRRRTDCRVCAC